MKIETIIYVTGELAWKFLKLTLPWNSQFFDNIILVGREEDREEFSKIGQENITCLISDTTNDKIKTFDRGRAFNIAFNFLKFRKQIVLMDCDIIIPADFNDIKKNYKFDKEWMYGARRYLLPKYKDFEKLVNGTIILENYVCPFGIGYGFMSIFNWNAYTIQNRLLNNLPVYPEGYEMVGSSDYIFRNNNFGETSYGEKEYIGNLAELPMRVYHLGDCLSKTGSPAEEFWSN